MNSYEAAVIQMSVALTLIRNKLVDFHNGYALLKHNNGSDAELRKLVEERFSNWEEILTTTDALKESVDKIMKGGAL